MKVFDGHNDTLTNVFIPERAKGRTFFEESDIGHIDLPRAKKGDLAGGLFAIYTPPPPSSKERDAMFGVTTTKDGYIVSPKSPIDQKYAEDFTNSIIDFAYKLESESKQSKKIVKSFDELQESLNHNILAVVLHFEGAEAIKEDLSNLEDFYNKGLRSLGLVWSRPNVFGNGVPFIFPHSPDTGNGLTNAGKELVKKCNELGIIVDLAHINEKGFFEVAHLTTAPLVVTHGDVYALCEYTRNYTDAQLDAIGESGGVIGINFEPMSTRSDGKDDDNTPLSVLVSHIDYVVKRIGIDHVAFGSDFDGAGMPRELKDVTGLPKIITALKNAGYEKAALEKITSKNWLRVIKKTWKA
jgi:membrane dipeptidase